MIILLTLYNGLNLLLFEDSTGREGEVRGGWQAGVRLNTFFQDKTLYNLISKIQYFTHKNHNIFFPCVLLESPKCDFWKTAWTYRQKIALFFSKLSSNLKGDFLSVSAVALLCFYACQALPQCIHSKTRDLFSEKNVTWTIRKGLPFRRHQDY